MTQVYETNPLANGHPADLHEAETVDWTTPGLYVTRLRLLSDPGYPWWDVSYCYGTLEGKTVRVQLPFDRLPRRGFRRTIVKHAQNDGVYAVKLGILDNISTLL